MLAANTDKREEGLNGMQRIGQLLQALGGCGIFYTNAILV